METNNYTQNRQIQQDITPNHQIYMQNQQALNCLQSIKSEMKKSSQRQSYHKQNPLGFFQKSLINLTIQQMNQQKTLTSPEKTTYTTLSTGNPLGMIFNTRSKIPLWIYLMGMNGVVFLMFKRVDPRWMLRHFTITRGLFLRRRYHTLLTHGFAHFNNQHIAMNMLGLFFFGRFLELCMPNGRTHLANLYLLGSVTGGLSGFYVNILKQGHTNLLGASGAISSIMSFYILNFPNQPVYLYGFIKIPSWMLGVFLFSQSALQVNSASRVSHSGHLGGLLAGGTYYLYQNYKNKQKLKGRRWN